MTGLGFFCEAANLAPQRDKSMADCVSADH
jgi:hypothetical protein